jgi:hypothetical protein
MTTGCIFFCIRRYSDLARSKSHQKWSNVFSRECVDIIGKSLAMTIAPSFVGSFTVCAYISVIFCVGLRMDWRILSSLIRRKWSGGSNASAVTSTRSAAATFCSALWPRCPVASLLWKNEFAANRQKPSLPRVTIPFDVTLFPLMLLNGNLFNDLRRVSFAESDTATARVGAAFASEVATVSTTSSASISDIVTLRIESSLLDAHRDCVPSKVNAGALFERMSYDMLP